MPFQECFTFQKEEKIEFWRFWFSYYRITCQNLSTQGLSMRSLLIKTNPIHSPIELIPKILSLHPDVKLLSPKDRARRWTRGHLCKSLHFTSHQLLRRLLESPDQANRFMKCVFSCVCSPRSVRRIKHCLYWLLVVFKIYCPLLYSLGSFLFSFFQ